MSYYYAKRSDDFAKETLVILINIVLKYKLRDYLYLVIVFELG